MTMTEERVIRYRGGAVAIDEDLMAKAKAIESELYSLKGKSLEILLRQGALLALVKAQDLAVFLLDEYEAVPDGWSAAKSPRQIFLLWAYTKFNWKESHCWRLILLATVLYPQHRELFDTWIATGQHPPLARLEWIGCQNRYELPEAPELMAAAGEAGNETDWRIQRRAILGEEVNSVVEEELEERKERLADWLRSSRKLNKWNSKDYRVWVADIPCMFTGSPESHAAHVDAKGMGGARGDFCNVVPLCLEKHQHQHSAGWEAFCLLNGTDMDSIRTYAMALTQEYIIYLEETVKSLKAALTDASKPEKARS